LLAVVLKAQQQKMVENWVKGWGTASIATLFLAEEEEMESVHRLMQRWR
jgi:hypothetical protein